MDTRIDGQIPEGLEETWVDERTVPDLELTSIEGEVWPRRARAARVEPAPRSEFEWR